MLDLTKHVNIEEYKKLRREFHQNPELGFETESIGNIVADKLRSWGFEVHQGLAKTGVVGTLRVGNKEKILGLRADMDALPIIENSGKDWSSKIHGKFHGCGHDGHTTMLLAAAEYLSKTKNFDGTLRVIFQPAEELLYGGKVMVEDGLFKLFPCDNIFGLHNFPGLAVNEFFYTPDTAMASCDTVHIEVFGKGSHGAMPEYSIDATMIASYIVTALQSIVSRNIAPQQAAVITVGSIHSGDAANVVNDYAIMKLSVRALSKETRNLLVERIEKLATEQAKSFGATLKFEVVVSCPSLHNDATSTEFAKKVAKSLVGEDKVHQIPPLMGSEDFALMLEKVPGFYIMLGAGPGAPVHNPKYDFNDDIIELGAKYWVQLTESYLK